MGCLNIIIGRLHEFFDHTGIISGTTTIVELIPDVMARLRWIQASKISLPSTTTGGRSTVAACSSYQWQLEIGIRQGQLEVL